MCREINQNLNPDALQAKRPSVLAYTTYNAYNTRCIRVDAGIGPLQISDVLHFGETETPGTRILNFLRRFCIKLYCILTNKRNVQDNVRHTSVAGSRLH
jgi:hypothetical protein